MTSTAEPTPGTLQFNPQSLEALDLLKRRRSVVAKNMGLPGPTPDQLSDILEIGARVPDHGKLAPWRFIIFEGEARAAIGKALATAFAKDEPKADADRVSFEAERFLRAPTVVAVISSPSSERPIPLWEQHLSAAAVCQNMAGSCDSHGIRRPVADGMVCLSRGCKSLSSAQRERANRRLHLHRHHPGGTKRTAQARPRAARHPLASHAVIIGAVHLPA